MQQNTLGYKSFGRPPEPTSSTPQNAREGPSMVKPELRRARIPSSFAYPVIWRFRRGPGRRRTPRSARKEGDAGVGETTCGEHHVAQTRRAPGPLSETLPLSGEHAAVTTIRGKTVTFPKKRRCPCADPQHGFFVRSAASINIIRSLIDGTAHVVKQLGTALRLGAGGQGPRTSGRCLTPAVFGLGRSRRGGAYRLVITGAREQPRAGCQP